MHTIPLARVSTLALAVLLACEPEPLLPEDAPERAESPPPFDGPQLRMTAEPEPDEPTGRMSGFREGEEYKPPPRPGAELAALDAELTKIMAAVLARLDARGVTRGQLKSFRGDAAAERDLLGMTDSEYLRLRNRLAHVHGRIQDLTRRPLARDGRGGDEWICTTETTATDLEDGTILITDQESCRPGMPQGGPGRCLLGGPGCGDGPGGGGGSNPPPMFTQFERECKDSGGEVKNGLCQCHQSNGCITASLASSSATIAACLTLTGCIPVFATWAITYIYCRQEPCDKVNRHYGKDAP